MLRVVCLTPWLVGCAPPPAVGPPADTGTVAPSVHILYPPADIGEVALAPDGGLALLVVVEIDHLRFVEPGPDHPPAHGEGHWHLFINGVFVAAPKAQYHEWTAEPGAYAPGQAMSLRVALADNAHDDLDAAHGWEQSIEFTVAAAEE